MKTSWILTTVVVALSITSCRETEFIQYANPVPGESISYSNRIRDIVSGSTVDIVWVIDNSGSMYDYQQSVIQNADLFMQSFIQQGLEWKMGVISSDINEAPYIGFTAGSELDSRTPNGAATFGRAVSRLGTSGSATERFFQPTLTALRTYPGFHRAGAPLVVIVVTDAPDQGNVRGQEFLDQAKVLYGQSTRMMIYGAFAARDLGCRTDEGLDYAGSDYEVAINATQGKFYKLCDANFGHSLAELGKDITTRVSKPILYLSKRPRAGTLTISYHGEELPPGLKENGGYWLYDIELNAVIFNDLAFAPNDREEVRVSYRADNGMDLPGQ